MERSILAAWDVVKDRVLNDPFELRARLARRRGKTLSRPPRAWCLAVRSNDTRIDPASAIVLPTAAIQKHEPHSVTLDARLLRMLCQRVDLEYGLTCDEVADRLGVSMSGLTTARLRGVLRSDYVRGLAGRRGHPIPIVYSRQTLDPSASLFAEPDPAWTWTARFLTSRVPDDLSQTVQRIPHWLPRQCEPRLGVDRTPTRPSRRLPPPPPDHVWYKWSVNNEYLGDDPRHWRKSPNDPGAPPPPEALKSKRKRSSRKRSPQHPVDSLLFHGWLWLCPGCNRTCRKLYYPLPRTAHLLAHVDPTLPVDEFDASWTPPAPTFACNACHGVRGFSHTGHTYWNELIAHLPGCLLYGHEVPHPPEWKQIRQKPYKPRVNIRPSKRREEVRERLLKGMTYQQIADDLGVAWTAVHTYAHALYKHEGVHSRADLAKKHNANLPPPPPSAMRLEVLRRLEQGQTRSQVARELGITRQAVFFHVKGWRKREARKEPKHHAGRESPRANQTNP